MLTGKKPLRFVMFSLDGAGKTTILYKLTLPDQDVTTIPTIGFNVESIQYKNFQLTIFDVGGGDKSRPLWRHYLVGTQGIIFVVDSSDHERVGEAREEFYNLLCYEESEDAKFLIFANKQDQENAMSVEELSEKLGLNEHRQRDRIHIQPAIAIRGEGLYEGLEWLANQITT